MVVVVFFFSPRSSCSFAFFPPLVAHFYLYDLTWSSRNLSQCGNCSSFGFDGPIRSFMAAFNICSDRCQSPQLYTFTFGVFIPCCYSIRATLFDCLILLKYHRSHFIASSTIFLFCFFVLDPQDNHDPLLHSSRACQCLIFWLFTLSNTWVSIFPSSDVNIRLDNISQIVANDNAFTIKPRRSSFWFFLWSSLWLRDHPCVSFCWESCIGFDWNVQ